eukprot:Amastigsp_a514192_104.p4 type:complete len:123 gc:universal Amastigsp_a514192_104:560-192(-)
MMRVGIDSTPSKRWRTGSRSACLQVSHGMSYLAMYAHMSSSCSSAETRRISNFSLRSRSSLYISTRRGTKSWHGGHHDAVKKMPTSSVSGAITKPSFWLASQKSTLQFRNGTMVAPRSSRRR